MAHLDSNPHRQKAIHSFARWAAASATRQGCPIRGKKIYAYLNAVPLDEVLAGSVPISGDEFSAWHRRTVEFIATLPGHRPLGIGWAAKLVNLLLKVQAFIGSEGRPGLREHLHPPIDNLLINAVRRRYPLRGPNRAHNESIRYKTDKFRGIVNIDTYETYLEIIEGLREVARRENCSPCEVEFLWPG